MLQKNNDLAENKLLILYFVGVLDIPLTNSQITQYFLENNLMNYFDLQQYLSELVSADFLNCMEARSKHFYSITSKGSETLDFFKRRISFSLREAISIFAEENRSRLKKESQISAEYTRLSDESYEVACRVMEQDLILLELKINVPTKSQAKIISANWKSKAPEIYKTIMKYLSCS
jgi:predicted transcriptional regulator